MLSTVRDTSREEFDSFIATLPDQGEGEIIVSSLMDNAFPTSQTYADLFANHF
jgi:hypothetical protein